MVKSAAQELSIRNEQQKSLSMVWSCMWCRGLQCITELLMSAVCVCVCNILFAAMWLIIHGSWWNYFHVISPASEHRHFKLNQVLSGLVHHISVDLKTLSLSLNQPSVRTQETPLLLSALRLWDHIQQILRSLIVKCFTWGRRLIKAFAWSLYVISAVWWFFLYYLTASGITNNPNIILYI